MNAKATEHDAEQAQNKFAWLRPRRAAPSWYETTTARGGQRGPLRQDLDVDVCVVGGGLAGLTVARELSQRKWSVALLEQGRIAANASGRNAGFVLPGFAEQPQSIISRVGLGRAKELWALSLEGLNYVRESIANTPDSEAHPVEGFLRVSRRDDDSLARQAELLQQHFAADAALWPTDQVRAQLRSSRYFRGLHWPSAFHIQPLNYALELACAAERGGARIFEATKAHSVDVEGVRKHVNTPGGRVRARHLVLAGGAQLGATFPVLARTIVPVTTYVGTTERCAQIRENVRYSGAIADTRPGGDYYRVVDGDRLLWGGGISTLGLPLGGLAWRISRRIRSVYPQLGAVHIAQAWSGVMSYAVHKMPQIGEIAPGVWVAGAFGGHGINTTALAGRLIAAAIVEGDDRWRLFSPYELVSAGGRPGRLVVQALILATGLKEAAAEAWARSREQGTGRSSGLFGEPWAKSEAGASAAVSAQPEASSAGLKTEPRTAAEPAVGGSGVVRGHPVAAAGPGNSELSGAPSLPRSRPRPAARPVKAHERHRRR